MAFNLQHEFATQTLSDFAAEGAALSHAVQPGSAAEERADTVLVETVEETDQTETEAQQGDMGETELLTYEYKDDPLKAFIREIEEIAEQDPEAALSLAMMARDEKTFDALSGTARLEEKIRELLTLNNIAPETVFDAPEAEADDFSPAAGSNPSGPMSAPQTTLSAALKPNPF